MHNQRIAIIISSIVGILATFMPYMSVWSRSVSLIETGDGTGYIIIIAFAGVIISALSGNLQKPITKSHLTVTNIASLIPAILLLLFLMSISSKSLVKAFSKFEIGFYLVIITSIITAVLAYTLRESESSIRDSKISETFYCTGCGKKYAKKDSGGYCDECGTKL